MLQQQPQLQIVGEASDGVEAVQKAEELQPDLVLLDIGLPKLNGIEAGRRIFALSPHSKILFISQETSIEVVHQALAVGGRGYLPKTDAASELLTAINAVLRGEIFIGNIFTGHDLVETRALEHKKVVHRHEVAFYSDDRLFLVDLTHFVEAALNAGDAVIVIVTESHRNGLFSGLQAHGVDVGNAVAQGRYIPLNADEAISAIMFNRPLDSVRFLELFGRLIVAAKWAAKSSPPRVAIFGEGVNLLCAQGNIEAAIQIEGLCSQLARTYNIDIRCAYFLDSVPGGTKSDIFQQICAEHSAVISQ
jgi:CheY-like chemotaxis protein